MKPKKVNRDSWDPVVKENILTPYFTVVDFLKILSKANVSFNKPDEENINRIIGDLNLNTGTFESRKRSQEGPKIPNIRVTLKEFVKRAKAFMVTLDQIDSRTKYEYLLKDIKGGNVLFDNTFKNVIALGGIADAKLRNLPNGKRDENKALNWYIYELMLIYDSIPQENSPRKLAGSRNDFVWRCLRHRGIRLTLDAFKQKISRIRTRRSS
jgi:hypothetical protein